MSETLEGKAPAEPKNSARQRRALRKGEKIAFGGFGSCRTEKAKKLPLEGEAPAEPKRVWDV